VQSFKDSLNRTWSVTVDVNTIKRVRTMLDVDLLTIQGGDLAERLASDPILMVDVLYCICKPEADSLGVSDEDFGRGLVGDAIDDGYTSLMEGIIGFFRREQRTTLMMAWQKIQQLELTTNERIREQIQNGTIDAEVKKQLDELLGDSG